MVNTSKTSLNAAEIYHHTNTNNADGKHMIDQYTKQPDVKNANVVNASLTRPPTVIDRHPQQQSKTTNDNHPDSRYVCYLNMGKNELI